MQVKDLRIGNRVLHGQTESTITRIDKEYIIIEYWTGNQIRNSNLMLEGIQPIKLTDEIFFNYGFIKVEALDVECGWVFEKPVFGEFYKEKNYWLPKPNNFADAFGESYKLEYVHQLQNLYYALIGQEIKTVR